MSKVAVSVIMPMYRPGRFIHEAIDSIVAEAKQGTEIIIVDDGSKDGTAESIEERGFSNLLVLRQDNAGPASARNLGLSHARGEFVAFLDADDIWLEGKMGIQLQLMIDHPYAGIVMGNTVGFGEHAEDGNQRFLANWESRQFLQLGSALVRREVFDKAGMFDPSLRYAEDIDWLLKAREAGIIIFEHTDPVLRYRRHKNNMTNDTDARDKGFVSALMKNLQRKRAQAH